MTIQFQIDRWTGQEWVPVAKRLKSHDIAMNLRDTLAARWGVEPDTMSILVATEWVYPAA